MNTPHKGLQQSHTQDSLKTTMSILLNHVHTPPETVILRGIGEEVVIPRTTNHPIIADMLVHQYIDIMCGLKCPCIHVKFKSDTGVVIENTTVMIEYGESSEDYYDSDMSRILDVFTPDRKRLNMNDIVTGVTSTHPDLTVRRIFTMVGMMVEKGDLVKTMLDHITGITPVYSLAPHFVHSSELTPQGGLPLKMTCVKSRDTDRIREVFVPPHRTRLSMDDIITTVKGKRPDMDPQDVRATVLMMADTGELITTEMHYNTHGNTTLMYSLPIKDYILEVLSPGDEYRMGDIAKAVMAKYPEIDIHQIRMSVHMLVDNGDLNVVNAVMNPDGASGYLVYSLNVPPSPLDLTNGFVEIPESYESKPSRMDTPTGEPLRDRILKILEDGPRSLDSIKRLLGRNRDESMSLPCGIKITLHEMVVNRELIFMSDPSNGEKRYALVNYREHDDVEVDVDPPVPTREAIINLITNSGSKTLDEIKDILAVMPKDADNIKSIMAHQEEIDKAVFDLKEEGILIASSQEDNPTYMLATPRPHSVNVPNQRQYIRDIFDCLDGYRCNIHKLVGPDHASWVAMKAYDHVASLTTSDELQAFREDITRVDMDGMIGQLSRLHEKDMSEVFRNVVSTYLSIRKRTLSNDDLDAEIRTLIDMVSANADGALSLLSPSSYKKEYIEHMIRVIAGIVNDPISCTAAKDLTLYERELGEKFRMSTPEELDMVRAELMRVDTCISSSISQVIIPLGVQVSSGPKEIFTLTMGRYANERMRRTCVKEVCRELTRMVSCLKWKYSIADDPDNVIVDKLLGRHKS